MGEMNMNDNLSMTPRERINAVIHFRKADVLPWVESFYVETLLNWSSQGLSLKDLAVVELRIANDGAEFHNWPHFIKFNPYTHFGCANLNGFEINVDLGPLPRFNHRVLNEDEKYAEYMTETGARARRIKQISSEWYNMPMFTEFPVKERKSWEQYKDRLDPNDQRRYPKDWDKDAYARSFERYQDGNTVLHVSGFYGFGAELMGIPSFVKAFYRDPDLIHEMIEHWETYTIETIRDAVETLKGKIDLVTWWEDMAEKHGPNISPALYREILLPHYKRVTGFLNKNHIDRILMDSDGNINPILDLVVDAGITGLWPLEVGSSMDIREIRRRYGTKLFLVGNLDKREIVKGGEAMRKEIDSKVPLLKEEGGYIPGMDHLVPADCSLDRFKEYAEYLKKYL
jgi:hypothetical protein